MAQNSFAGTKKLEGKVAIITGGASGIGEATARLFSIHGAKVVIADIQDEKGRIVNKSIGPNNSSYVHCDVTKEEEVKSMVEFTVQTYGKLHIMFSNAGILRKPDEDPPVLDLNLSETDLIWSVNARGMAACVKHAAKAMVELGVKGSIVCTGSTAAVSGGIGWWTGYHMSKHAVLGLMRCASKQLGKHGIRVNCVSPSVVATPLTCEALEESAEEIEKLFQTGTNLKEVVLKAEDVAEAVLFLASDDSGFITGHNLMVDGGRCS
ncbi:OLC1v1012746C1 [Oldenlandia corymbosa var. corymbosa]|uniref:OLC1v1012746C1 n=1 Tax=Oldenlandia corymbosa var. corymbosa TaxID=529605 RepID=A0AAV1DXB2_OLDCO|nr:OLC1v1012746C1 [Oldenlandia corymbosa var. corymbosa]